MKKTLTILLLFSLFSAIAFAQQNNFQDVVYLKDGSIIRGMIIEQVPNKSIKIETADKSVFVYQMDVIEKITKEEIKSEIKAPLNFPKLKYTFGHKINPIGGKKSPWLAGGLSLLIPGIGQFYNGDVGSGLFYMTINITNNIIRTTQVNNGADASLSTIAGYVINIASIINAATIANRVNKARGYYLGNNTYLNISPSIIRNEYAFNQSDMFDYGLTARLSF